MSSDFLHRDNPFASPELPPGGEASGDGGPMGYRSARGLAIANLLVITACGGVLTLNGLIAVVSGLFWEPARSDQAEDPSQWENWMSLLDLPLAVQTALVLGSAIVFFLWLYRVGANARAGADPPPRYSPIMAVVWWLIPVANLILPFLALLEIARASSPEAEQGQPHATRHQGLIEAYWLFFILRMFGTAILVVHFPGFGDADAIAWSLLAEAALLGINLAELVLLALVILRITDDQHLRWQRPPADPGQRPVVE